MLGPDAPAEAGEHVGRPLLQQVERAAAKHLVEREVRRSSGNPDADQATEDAAIAQAHGRRRAPQVLRVSRALAAMSGTQRRLGQPAVEVHGQECSPIALAKGGARGDEFRPRARSRAHTRKGGVMRRLILQTGVSIDGYVAALDGSHPWGYANHDEGA